MMRISALVFVVLLAFAPCVARAQSDDTAPPASTASTLSGDALKNFNAMTPAQQQAAIAQSKQKWQSMNPDDQNALKQQALAQFNNMSPAQQQALEKQALSQWQNMTPEQQQDLKGMLPDLLRGNPDSQ